jgi:hypothetical protein
VSGAASVVKAVQAGRKAAEAIDRSLGGDGELFEYGVTVSTDMTAPNEIALERRNPACVINAREASFAERESGFDETTAIAQALRCSRCDLRLSVAGVVPPPDKYKMFSDTEVKLIPDEPGVLTLFNINKEVTLIGGAENMKEFAQEQLEDSIEAAYMVYELHQMFTQRESELLSEHLQQHGSLPGGNDLDDELF